jgi:hypothetical protein
MKRVVEKQVGPDLMLYDGETDSVHILNSTAQLIYQLYQEGLKLNEISDALRARFNIPEGQALEEDVQRVIRDMTAQGLV